jgi:hypothetical protein
MPQPSRILIAATVALIVAVAALLASVGADARWLAALGHVIMQRGSVPAGVPFAADPTSQWPNALVLAELAFNGLEQTLGDRGLMLAQLIALVVALTVLARDSVAGGAGPVGTCAALLLLGVGALPSLAIARVQLFSLILLPVVIALLRAQARRPSRQIWLVVPLLALWSNLHGAALVGLAVVLAYLLLSRARQQPLLSLCVGASAVAALCLTPALLHTVSYYHGVLTNVAAQRGQGQWGPLSLGAPLDDVMIIAAVALGFSAVRARPALWELAVILGLAAMTVNAERSGVWLLFVLLAPAGRTINPHRTWQGLAPVAAVVSVTLIAFAVVRGPVAQGPSRALLAQALALAHGTPVLAGDGIDEQVALAGGMIVAGNPIDAFSRPDQALYLDWMAGTPAGRGELTAQVRVALVERGSPSQRLMQATPGYVDSGGDRTTELFERGSRGVRKF